MDEEPTSPQHKIYEHNPAESAAPHPAPAPANRPPEPAAPAPDPDPSPTPSPFEPRPAEPAPELPAVKDHDRLRLATSSIVQQGLSLKAAAERYGVDPDALHVWHRTYVNFIGKDLFAATSLSPRERVEIDDETSRKFDENWDEMMRQAELERPQLSPIRKRLLSSPFTRWMFRDEKLDKLTVSGAVAVLAFSLLAVRAGTQHLGSGGSGGGTEEAAGKAAAEFDPSDVGNMAEEQAETLLLELAGVLEEFVTLETWQERLPFVRNPDRVKPLMAAYYETHGDGPIRELVIDPGVSFIDRDDTTFVLMSGEHPKAGGAFGERQSVIFLAELRKGDPRALFDWEVLVNYQPVSWDEFVTSKSTSAAPFRVRVATGDYYNQPFMNPDEFVSFALKPMHHERIVHGFVRRGTELAKTLQAHVSKELKGNRAMILNLRYPADAKFDNILEIESIVADSWLGD